MQSGGIYVNMKLAINGVCTALWEKWAEFRFEWKKITATALVTPLMYLIALGWGLGNTATITDRPYINFLVPGILALTTMNTSFSAVAMPLNVQRLFERSFDQIVISPTPMCSYILGQVFGGALRGMYAGILILLLAIPFGARISVTILLFLTMLLGGMTFSAFGVVAALVAATHADVSRFSTFVIFPMTFLCNTIFPIERTPELVRMIVKILPLTQMSNAIRTISYGKGAPIWPYLILSGYLALFIAVSNIIMFRKKSC